MPFGDGSSLTMFRDRAATAREIGRFSADDARAYERLLSDWDAVKGAWGRLRYRPPAGPSEALRALAATTAPTRTRSTRAPVRTSPPRARTIRARASGSAPEPPSAVVQR